MKKTVALAVAGLSMLGAAGQASASFEKGNLFMVGYNETTKEVGVDLGNLDGILGGLSTAPTVLKTGLDFSAAAGPSNKPVSLAFFQDTSDWNTYDISMYYATTKSTVSPFSNDENSVMNAYSFSGAAQVIGNYYKTFGSTTVVANPGYAKSYDTMMNMGSGVPGNYGGFNYDINAGEAKNILAAVEPVDMYLYHFVMSWDTGMMELVPANAGQDWTAKLTLDNGTLTAVNAAGGSEVPVPATALLFGSSLLGLLGVRRKNS